MSIDAYSPCPGGAGKKIKFCCGDLLPELQKIDRMIEGDQFSACLRHIDRLMERESNRDRACLLAMKCLVLRNSRQRAAAENAVADFLEKHPDNQIALAEAAILAAENDVLAAHASMLKALRSADGRLEPQTYAAMGLVGAILHQRGFPIPARALALLMSYASGGDERVEEMLSAFGGDEGVPLLLRDDQPIVFDAGDAPWRDRFTEAMQPFQRGDWLTTVERLAALAADVPDATAVWRNLATYRGRTADNPGCIKALRRYAGLRAGEENGLEDVVEAEAVAMFLADDPLGDQMEFFVLDWAVKDAARAQETFLPSPRWETIPFDPIRFGDGDTPPPKGLYLLLDKPMPEAADELSLETVPRVIGSAALFGRQTDREARLEVMGVSADDLPAVAALVGETAGETVEPDPKQEVVGKKSASQEMLHPIWRPPQGASVDRLRTMRVQHARESLLDRWPDLKLGVLDGRSPRQAAAAAASNARLLATVMVLEHWTERFPGGIDLNRLRARLGLPELGPIDPRKQEVEKLPAVRLSRVTVEPLSDEKLLYAYDRAEYFSVRAAKRKFARAIIERPSFDGTEQRREAYATMARTEEDVDRALEYVDRGRRAALSAGKSCAAWDLMELSFCFVRRDGKEATRLLEHVQRRHMNEPGVGEALTRMMMDVGLLRPDGTPAIDPDAPEPAMAAAGPPPEAEPAALWTPDADRPGGGKLWTPGQE